MVQNDTVCDSRDRLGVDGSRAGALYRRRRARWPVSARRRPAVRSPARISRVHRRARRSGVKQAALSISRAETARATLMARRDRRDRRPRVKPRSPGLAAWNSIQYRGMTGRAGNFHTVAAVRRGDLLLSVETGGDSPALTPPSGATRHATAMNTRACSGFSRALRHGPARDLPPERRVRLWRRLASGSRPPGCGTARTREPRAMRGNS